MTQRHRFTLQLAGAMAGAALLLAAPAAQASTLDVIYQIGNAGDHLTGTLPNADGSVFVVSDVGPNGRGQILLLSPDHKKYNASVIKAFACDTDGEQPGRSLTADAAGNVWGMTNTGCGTGLLNGTLFELVKPAKGKKWTFKTVLQMPTSIGFEGVVGSGYGKIAFDDVGNLYGLATLGCNDGSCGRIYEVPVSVLNGGKGKVKILYSFPQVNGGQPVGLIRDKNGNFFGVTYGAGAHNLGSTWEVSPPKRKNGNWTGRTIYDFCSDPSFDNCDDGFNPNGLPALDANGALYGTTFSGGPNFAFGTMWSLTPSPNGKKWAFRQLHEFTNATSGCPTPTVDYGVSSPVNNTVFNANGQLLTFTQAGGYFNPCGTFQTAIVGGLMSVDPSSGADAVASNQFAVQTHVSGPYLPVSSPSVLGNTVFGTSSEYYDAGTDTYSAGVVFKITP